jgi:ABC-type nitrate/sulfonate/bicarbonate transport system substrate-binding protein
MQAMIAGQLDLGIQQPRNTRALIGAGGAVLYQAEAPVPQEIWVVTREVWKDHRDSVCAFIEGLVQGKRWASEGPGMRANIGKALEIVRKRGIDPTEDELADWERELSGNQSLDGGAELAAFDTLQRDLKKLKIISPDFEWRKHAAFDCVWAMQEKLALPKRPERW